jgi:hypothetical protein
MKLEEVLPALRAGKKIRYGTHNAVPDFDWLANHYVNPVFLQSDNWSIVEDPATDEELAAAFEAEAEWCERCGANGKTYEYAVSRLRQAADMVRKRYVDPSWKVGGGK